MMWVFRMLDPLKQKYLCFRVFLLLNCTNSVGLPQNNSLSTVSSYLKVSINAGYPVSNLKTHGSTSRKSFLV